SRFIRSQSRINRQYEESTTRDDFVKDQVEPRNVLEIAAVACKQSEAMLNRLAGEPQILHPIAMLTAGRLNGRGERTEDFPASAVDGQMRLALQPPERRQPLLPDNRVFGNLGAKPKLRDRNRREKDGLATGQGCHVRGRQRATLNVDPCARIDQESHGFRTPLSSEA